VHTVEETIEQVRRLPRQDQQQLLEGLEELLDQDRIVEQPFVSEGPYTRSLALAGTIRTDFTDVSADKYKHLAEAYADRDSDE
jgi:hypothetical protein